MGLLRDIQTEIETRSLSGGGWSSGHRGPAAIETTAYALMALAEDQEPVRRNAIDVLLRTQNPDGSWPGFEGDDQEGCWTTSLALIALRSTDFSPRRIERAKKWLLDKKGREGHWFWKWKFRTVDRAVQFNPEKYGWPWFPETVSWVIPTAFALIALKQSIQCCRTEEQVINRIQTGTDMLRDRACPQGGWNAGNGIVFGSALVPHIDATGIALLALTDDADPNTSRGRNWLRQASRQCSSAYSLSWSTIAFLIHHDRGADQCLAKLLKAVSTKCSNVEPIALAAIALRVADGDTNPFQW